MIDKFYKAFIATNSFLFIALILFQWFTLVDLGPLNFKQYHIFMLLMLLGLFFQDFRTSLFAFLKQFQVFLTSYFLVLLAYGISITWTAEVGAAIAYLFKVSVYYLVFILFSIFIIEIVRLKLTKIMCYSATFGCFSFIVFAQLVLYLAGENLFKTLALGLLSGNPAILMYSIFKKIFNFDIFTFTFFSKMDRDLAILVSMKNNLATGFLIHYFVIALFQKGRNFLFSIAKYTSAALIFITISRSNIIGFAFSILLYLILTAEEKKMQYLLQVLGIISITGLVFFTFAEEIMSVFSALFSRFSEISDNSRIGMFELVMEKIKLHPIKGYGLATKTDLGDGHEGYVHNFFLNIWYMSGLLGIVAGLTMYLSLTYLFLKRMLHYLLRKNRLKMSFSIAWMLVLPAQPLFRILVSGGAGDFAFMEWVILSFYFGLLYVLINDLNENKNLKFNSLKHLKSS